MYGRWIGQLFRRREDLLSDLKNRMKIWIKSSSLMLWNHLEFPWHSVVGEMRAWVGWVEPRLHLLHCLRIKIFIIITIISISSITIIITVSNLIVELIQDVLGGPAGVLNCLQELARLLQIEPFGFLRLISWQLRCWAWMEAWMFGWLDGDPPDKSMLRLFALSLPLLFYCSPAGRRSGLR